MDISEGVLAFLRDPEVQSCIEDTQWEKFWNTARYGLTYRLALNFEEMAELYDLLIASKVSCPEPAESQLIHKYLGAEGILNENIKNFYDELVPYIGNKVKVLHLDLAENWSDTISIDDNFTWLYWDIEVEGFGIAQGIDGECIDFPQYGIKNSQP